MMRLTKERDTGTVAYDWFISEEEDGTECEVREAYVDPDALVDHAFHVLETVRRCSPESAYDHKMACSGDPSPEAGGTGEESRRGRHAVHAASGAQEPASVHWRAMQNINAAAAAFLASKRVAVTGVSRTPKTHGSNNVYGDCASGAIGLRGQPEHPGSRGGSSVSGPEIDPRRVEAVVIGHGREIAEDTMRECAELGIKQVWMHRGPARAASRTPPPTTAGSTASPSSMEAAR